MTCRLQGWEKHGKINTVKYLIPQPKNPSIPILKDRVVLLFRQPLFSIPKQDKLTVTTPLYSVGTMGLLTPWRRSLNLKRVACRGKEFPGCTFIHNPYPTAFPYGNGMVLHFYQQQESSTTKTVHKVINKGLKLMYSRLTLVRISINLQAPRFFYIGTGVSLLFRERFSYI